MMCSFRVCLCWPTLLCWFFSPRLSTVVGSNVTLRLPERSSCKPGFYCPEGGEGPVPCPRGTFGPSFWATSINDCISCPPHHYGPRESLSNCLPCGPWSQQPLSGQDSCTCLQEGQVFQASDGQRPCTLGYTQKGEDCVLKVYEICKEEHVTRKENVWTTSNGNSIALSRCVYLLSCIKAMMVPWDCVLAEGVQA